MNEKSDRSLRPVRFVGLCLTRLPLKDEGVVFLTVVSLSESEAGFFIRPKYKKTVACVIQICYTTRHSPFGVEKMSSFVGVLKQSDIFYQFTPTQLELVANLCSEIILAKGEMVFEENSGSKELYVIARGDVNILINSSAGKKGTVVAIYGAVNLLAKWLWSMKVCVLPRLAQGQKTLIWWLFHEIVC